MRARIRRASYVECEIALFFRACAGGRADIDTTKIGLWGGSQGGWIAPLAATAPSARVRFVVAGADHQLELPRKWTNRPNFAPGYVETMLEWVSRQCATPSPSHGL
jgi:hypothetical protein